MALLLFKVKDIEASALAVEETSKKYKPTANAASNRELDFKRENVKFDKEQKKCDTFLANIKKVTDMADNVANEWFNIALDAYKAHVLEKDKIPSVHYVLTKLEDKLFLNKGACDFLKGTCMDKWMERFYQYTFEEEWEEGTVCHVCGKDDDRVIMECSMETTTVVDRVEVHGVCNKWGHIECCGYPADYKYQSAPVHAEWLEEYFACLDCKTQYKEIHGKNPYPAPRDSEDGRAEEKRLDEGFAAQIHTTLLVNQAQIERFVRKSKAEEQKNLLKYTVDAPIKTQILPLLLTNGPSTRVQDLFEVVPDPKKAMQRIHRVPWTFTQWYDFIKKNAKTKEIYPWKTLGMHKLSSVEDVNNWFGAFYKKFHPDFTDKYVDEGDKLHEMLALFKEARDIWVRKAQLDAEKEDEQLKIQDKNILHALEEDYQKKCDKEDELENKKRMRLEKVGIQVAAQKAAEAAKKAAEAAENAAMEAEAAGAQ
jgi:hypothetical protein